MNLSEFSLKRPVAAVVFNLLILLFGGLGFYFLGVREYPAIDPPIITVRTSYLGASPEIVESQITEPLEKAINGIAGVRSITSSSSLGSSTITVEFGIGSDLEQAANDVRDKVSQAIRNLPQDIDAPPVVAKADANADPIIFMPVQSTTRSITEVSDYAENVLMEQLQTIPGVSQVQIYGLKRYAMRLWIDPVKLAANQLTLDDIRQAINLENVEVPGGKVRGDFTELTVKTNTRLNTEEEFNNLIIKKENGKIIRLSDVGEAVLGAENEETQARRNNINSLSLAIIPQPGANYIEIADEFYRRFERIKKELPEDIILDVGIDKSRFIRKAVNEVAETLLIAVVLVVIIIFFFFRNWGIALRPLVDIPVSLIGAFFVMYVMDFSINVLTMLAIVLATGLVVDDGIVVTENIFRKLEEGKDKKTAAREGANEIYFAVIATSVVLAVVFLPVIFLQGFVGRLFREFGIVLACAVLISSFVSLSLTPVLSVKLATKSNKNSRFYQITEAWFNALENGYRRLLSAMLRMKWISVMIVLVCGTGIYFIGKNLQSELAPLEDRGLIRSPITAPEGTDFDYMSQIVYDLGQMVIDSIPERRMLFGIASPAFSGVGNSNTGFLSIILTPTEERTRSQKEIVEHLSRLYKQYPTVRVFPIQEQTINTGLSAGFQLPVQFVVQHLNFDKLKQKLPQFLEIASKDPAFQLVDVNLKLNKPELQIEIDRLRARELGVSALEIANTLQLALSGRRLDYFLKDGKQYQIIAQVERDDMDDPADLGNLYVKSQSGHLIQLDNVIKVSEITNPPQIFHYNRFKSATFSASLAPGKTIGDGIDAMNRIASEVLDDSFNTSLTGASRDFAESASNTQFAFLLALVLIYLVLAAQFESFIDPIIIMFTVPLALTGALLSLWFFGHTLNIFSQIGMIMLIGLVTKNGILIVEFANQILERTGASRVEAVLEASAIRLRPIVMTSLATMLGALPIALAIGSAGQSRIPLGVVIVGGVFFSLVLTLIVIPCFYAFRADKVKNESEVEK
jgi:multidrug efflux pump